MTAASLGTYRYTNKNISLRFDIAERKDGNRFNARVTGTVDGRQIDSKLRFETTDPLRIDKMIQDVEQIEGMSGTWEAVAQHDERRLPMSVGWAIREVEMDRGAVIDLDDGGTVTYEAKEGGGGCKNVVNAIGFAIGVIVTLGGLIQGNPWIVATGAGLMVTFGGRLTQGGDSFMDPGDGNWEWGVWY